MSRNFPPAAIEWVNDATWTMRLVQLDDIDVDDENSWAAHHQPDRVNAFVRQIEAGKPPKPAIMVKTDSQDELHVVDGHHRVMAYQRLNKPVPAFVGVVPDGDDRWEETHSSQRHQGDDPANKADGLPVAAGIAVVAMDTGRVLMLQRAMVDDDPAAGTWELPGGCLNPGESSIIAAQREWQEETGCVLPRGKITGTWVSANGVYQGFVLLVASEDEVPLFDGRDQVINPDDPDGDEIEVLAWWEPVHLVDCPAMRPELATDLDTLLELSARR